MELRLCNDLVEVHFFSEGIDYFFYCAQTGEDLASLVEKLQYLAEKRNFLAEPQ